MALDVHKHYYIQNICINNIRSLFIRDIEFNVTLREAKTNDCIVSEVFFKRNLYIPPHCMSYEINCEFMNLDDVQQKQVFKKLSADAFVKKMIFNDGSEEIVNHSFSSSFYPGEITIGEFE